MTNLATKDRLTATASCCGFTGTLAAIELHNCGVHEQGGRCEDYPCCGHTDGGGCQTTPEMTSDFYYRNPHMMHEPGSPEWYDALDDLEPDIDDVDNCCELRDHDFIDGRWVCYYCESYVVNLHKVGADR